MRRAARASTYYAQRAPRRVPCDAAERHFRMLCAMALRCRRCRHMPRHYFFSLLSSYYVDIRCRHKRHVAYAA